MGSSRTVTITTDHITLGQLLKLADVVGSGGEGKLLLEEGAVLLNGSVETQRGRKVRNGDRVTLPDGSCIDVRDDLRPV
ncbi:MAG: RNA-binding S4 domain-containing protein [Armatimonadetes bacterium]|nr:RNA-binding S4 domain-containing protein [Armatimonadota bacterium]